MGVGTKVGEGVGIGVGLGVGVFENGMVIGISIVMEIVKMPIVANTIINTQDVWVGFCEPTSFVVLDKNISGAASVV